ncbi:hydroxyphenylacetyl-CoA thioesterase PaaI [Chelatococcus sp. SYSU_G07232]|uniref:Hydroxyphenylacetyl-CoA thioesterase PaaI n=1 Tax=Chelatococcus albus TaxID=3047466 RepID=A0ABT7AFH3_9HYPH|nr:hydroxyphenylacetyl-CoA thioesterase PaaI [Chelatococcus sp. SYSU_G07232]MDJ1158101.1 hydroxyphenylacetyl-CoA thioesterase PaaI [Chelatococcus sp. SYSU_G07232]
MTAGIASVRSSEETARLAADTMWAGDNASRALGMEILGVGPGTATLAMTVTEAMTNGHGTAHGGFIFALADSAFAFACNSHGDVTVASHCDITFIRPGKRGDRLIATAREVSRAGRSGIYDVRVSADGVTIAEFRGMSRTVGGSFIEAVASAPESRTP